MHIKELIEKTLENKLAFLGAILIGGLIGTFFRGAGEVLGYLSEIFIDLMKMCVLPIVITSVILSISHFTSTFASHGIFRIVMKSILILVLCSVLGMIVPAIFNTGSRLDTSSSEELKVIVEKSAQARMGMDEPLETHNSSAILKFILDLIPENIFASVANNSVLSIVVFSIIFGVFLGKYSPRKSGVSQILSQTKDIFFRIFHVLEFFAPVILLCIVAKDVSGLGPKTLIGLKDFVGHFYLSVFILMFFLSAGMIFHMRISVMEWLRVMREPLVIGFATQSSAAAIPSSITALNRFHYDPNFSQLMIPLGSIIGRFGNILYFSFCTIFAVNIFQVELSFLDYGLIIVLSMMAGISTTGQIGILSVSLLSIVLTPLGIPFESLYPVLIAIETLIDPGRTLATVHTNCALVSFLDRPKKNKG